MFFIRIDFLIEGLGETRIFPAVFCFFLSKRELKELKHTRAQATGRRP